MTSCQKFVGLLHILKFLLYIFCSKIRYMYLGTVSARTADWNRIEMFGRTHVVRLF